MWGEKEGQRERARDKDRDRDIWDQKPGSPQPDIRSSENKIYRWKESLKAPRQNMDGEKQLKYKS